MNPQALRFGFLLFPRLTQLDLTGPYEVLARVPGASAHLIWKTLEPVASDTGLRILPDATFSDCPELDLLLVPGGSGVNELLGDSETLEFLRRTASQMGCQSEIAATPCDATAKSEIFKVKGGFLGKESLQGARALPAWKVRKMRARQLSGALTEKTPL